MLRVLPVAVLIAFTAPAHAGEPDKESAVAQQNQQQPTQQAPQRDCEKKRGEGVS